MSRRHDNSDSDSASEEFGYRVETLKTRLRGGKLEVLRDGTWIPDEELRRGTITITPATEIPPRTDLGGALSGRRASEEV